MRTAVILLVLAASAFADVFNGEKVRVGRLTCTCTFSLVADGTKLSPKSKAKCDKKCNGAATKVSLEGESGVFTFDMKVKKGKVALSKGSVVIATTTKTPKQTTQTTEQTGDSTTGDSTTGDSTTGDATTGASPTGGEGPTRPLSGSEPEPEPTGSGSGQVPVPMGSGPVTEATGSGSDPGPKPTGSGSGPRPTGTGSGPPTSMTGPGSGQGPKDGMQCSCRCDCPDGSGQCDCNCNCPMQSMAMVCAPGFTRVCPMMEEGCPPETEKVCPRGMEDKKPKGQSRMDGGSSGCQCVPDFLMSLMKEVDVEADVKELANRAAPDIFKNEKIKMGKTTCTCTLTLLVDGTKLSKKSKAVCDKKCSGAAKNVVLTGRSGIVYTLDVVSKKGKAKVKGTIKIATSTTPKPPKPTAKPPKPTRPSGTSKPTGPGSGTFPGGAGEQEKGPSCSCVATKTGESVEPTGPGSETGSGTGSEPGSEPGSGPESGSGSESGSEPEPSGSGISL